MPTLHDTIRRTTSRVMYGACIAAAIAIVGVLGLVTWFIFASGASHLSLEFFTQLPSGDPAHPGGMKHAVVGTLVLIGIASAIGVPIGVLAGIYLSEYSDERWLANPVRFIADVLTGVPSIVVGILGYELVVVPMGGHSGWAGAAALAFIMVPLVARTTEEMLRLVPQSYREASLGLGATKAETILRVVLPAATGSMITGVMLAVARIAGETAPLLFTALGSRFLTADLSQPFPSLTAQIFTYATGPYPEQKRLAWAGILVLVAILFILNISVRLMASRTVKMKRG